MGEFYPSIEYRSGALDLGEVVTGEIGLFD